MTRREEKGFANMYIEQNYRSNPNAGLEQYGAIYGKLLMQGIACKSQHSQPVS